MSQAKALKIKISYKVLKTVFLQILVRLTCADIDFPRIQKQTCINSAYEVAYIVPEHEHAFEICNANSCR